VVAARGNDPVRHAAYHVAETYPWNPTVQAQVYPYTRDRDSDLLAVENQISLTQTVELAHQRRHRQRVASAAWSQTRWQIAQIELTTVADVMRSYFTAVYLKELRDLARRNAALNTEVLAATQHRFEAGLASPAQRTMARVAMRTANRRAELAEANYQAAWMALRQTLVLAPAEHPAFSATLQAYRWRSPSPAPDASRYDIGMPSDGASQFARQASSVRPDVMAAQLGATMAGANLDLARASRVPNLIAGPLYQRDEAGTVFAGFSLQMNVPVWNTGRPLVRQRAAETRQQAIAWRQLRARANVEAASALERYARARQLGLAAAPDPEQAEGDLRSITRAFREGQATILEVLTVQNSLLQERRNSLALLNNVAQAAADVVAATGLPPEQLVVAQP